MTEMPVRDWQRFKRVFQETTLKIGKLYVEPRHLNVQESRPILNPQFAESRGAILRLLPNRFGRARCPEVRHSFDPGKGSSVRIRR